LDEAAAEFRQAILRDPAFVAPHHNLGSVLSSQGRLDEAAAEFRQAILLAPKAGIHHNSLGAVLYAQGRIEEAKAEYRIAIQLGPIDPGPHYNLGNALAMQGRLEDAEAEFQRAASLGLKGAPDKVRLCRPLLALSRRLPGVLRGDDPPRNARESLAFADLCGQPFQRRYAVAVRLYASAFAADEQLARDLKASNRYNAARAAALAASGQGEAAAALDGTAKAWLRAQALHWLRADLALWAKQAAVGHPRDRASGQETLRHWQRDPGLSGVRDRVALANLPQAEREAWQGLWADVHSLLAKLSGPQPAAKRQ
jgi:hypothetical protein